MTGSTLPAPAHQAAQSALSAAISDSIPPTSGTGLEPGQVSEETPAPAATTATPESTEDSEEGEIVEEQVVELEGSGPAGIDSDRTVFEDPKTFNVKHPLYSSWTLWYDSPNTRSSRNVPSTPMASVPTTPSTSAAQSWMDDIKKVISFDSVEEFWGLYNNIVPPSSLPQKANYYLFKDGIIPAWEDAANKDGGKWSIQLPRDKNRLAIDQMWLYTMLAAIGETFDPALSIAVAAAEEEAAANAASETPSPPATVPKSIITGVIVSARPSFYRVSIWTRLAPATGSTSAPNPDAAPPHPSETGEPLRARIEAIGKHFKMSILGYTEAQKLAGQLATDVEFQSHKDSERKPKGAKKWII